MWLRTEEGGKWPIWRRSSVWLAVVVVAIRVADVWTSALRVLLRDGRLAKCGWRPGDPRGVRRGVIFCRDVVCSLLELGCWPPRALPTSRVAVGTPPLLVLSLPLIAAGLTEVGMGCATDAHHRVAAGLFGLTGTGFESVFVTLTTGGWVSTHHKRPTRDGGIDVKSETAARFGVPLLLLLPCIFAAVAIAATFFDALQHAEHPCPTHFSGRTIFVANEVVGVVGLTDQYATNWPALVTKWVVLATVAMYVLVVFTTSVDTLRKSQESA